MNKKVSGTGERNGATKRTDGEKKKQRIETTAVENGVGGSSKSNGATDITGIHTAMSHENSVIVGTLRTMIGLNV